MRPSQALFLALALLAGCDKEPTKLDSNVEASAAKASAPTASTATAPDPPKPPRIVVEPSRTTVDGEPVQADDQDAVAKLTALVTGKPHVALESVSFAAVRKAKPSQVVTVMRALKKAQATGATVLTENRDKVVVELPLSFPPGTVPDCSVVAFINKDSSINVWNVAGAVAKRYSIGFGGPDMTLGSEAVRTAAATCDSPVWFVAADDAMQSWGVVFDLMYYAKNGMGGGRPCAPRTRCSSSRRPSRGAR